MQRTRGTVATEDQRNSGYKGPKEQRVKRTMGTEDQWVQKTRRTVRTEDYWNSGYRGPEE